MDASREIHDVVDGTDPAAGQVLRPARPRAEAGPGHGPARRGIRGVERLAVAGRTRRLLHAADLAGVAGRVARRDPVDGRRSRDRVAAHLRSVRHARRHRRQARRRGRQERGPGPHPLRERRLHLPGRDEPGAARRQPRRSRRRDAGARRGDRLGQDHAARADPAPDRRHRRRRAARRRRRARPHAGLATHAGVGGLRRPDAVLGVGARERAARRARPRRRRTQRRARSRRRELRARPAVGPQHARR